LPDTYEGWAQNRRVSPENASPILAWAESLRRLPDRNPPDSPTVWITGFLARQFLGEPCSPPTPQLYRQDIPLRPASVLAIPFSLCSGGSLLITRDGCHETRALSVTPTVTFTEPTEAEASVRACNSGAGRHLSGDDYRLTWNTIFPVTR